MFRCILCLCLLLPVGIIQAETPATIIIYNIWNGLTGTDHAEANLIQWVNEQNPDVLALQELVGFTQERLEKLAAQWGHNHAVILKEVGYPVGITSKTPIEVFEKTIRGMHHGFIHAKTADTQFFVIHFFPSNGRLRSKEADTIVSKAKPS